MTNLVSREELDHFTLLARWLLFTFLLLPFLHLLLFTIRVVGCVEGV